MRILGRLPLAFFLTVLGLPIFFTSCAFASDCTEDFGRLMEIGCLTPDVMTRVLVTSEHRDRRMLKKNARDVLDKTEPVVTKDEVYQQGHDWMVRRIRAKRDNGFHPIASRVGGHYYYTEPGIEYISRSTEVGYPAVIYDKSGLSEVFRALLEPSYDGVLPLLRTPFIAPGREVDHTSWTTESVRAQVGTFVNALVTDYNSAGDPWGDKGGTLRFSMVGKNNDEDLHVPVCLWLKNGRMQSSLRTFRDPRHSIWLAIYRLRKSQGDDTVSQRPFAGFPDPVLQERVAVTWAEYKTGTSSGIVVYPQQITVSYAAEAPRGGAYDQIIQEAGITASESSELWSLQLATTTVLIDGFRSEPKLEEDEKLELFSLIETGKSIVDINRESSP